MSLHAEIEAEPALLALVTSAAGRKSVTFAERTGPAARRARRRPRMIFETDRRLVALHRVGGELRYYAGGKAAEGKPVTEASERGTFGGVGDALRFAVAYLTDGRGLDAVAVPRAVRDRL